MYFFLLVGSSRIFALTLTQVYIFYFHSMASFYIYSTQWGTSYFNSTRWDPFFFNLALARRGSLVHVYKNQ